MEFLKDACDRAGWATEVQEPLKSIHIVDTMPDFHYDARLKSMYMDVVKPTDDQRLNRSCKTGLLLRDNETISGPCSLNTRGIPGAQAAPLYRFTNRGPHAFSNLTKSWENMPKSTPKILIPEHVNRPSNILDTRDIKGTYPHPKNMKIGDEARNTDPLDPRYILPSHPEPFIPIPNFVKSSLDVRDIDGARPSSRLKKKFERSSLSVNDIEGSRPGWKPVHHQRMGNGVRNLCLGVEDINGPFEQRVVRPSTAEVYRDIEGSHSRDLCVGRRPGTPHTLSLRNDDIEGANAGSASWEGTTRRKKEFAKHHTRSIEEQKESEELALKILTTRVQEQLKRKGLKPKDVSSTFQQLDRQKCGKLDMNEVARVFHTLSLDVDPTELNSISKAFVHPTGDGFVDYWKLVEHLVPVFPRLRAVQRYSGIPVATSISEGVESAACSKPCYDSSWVAELIDNRECRVPDGDSGNQFQAFNSGRPVTNSKYLKQPPSKYGMQAEPYQRPEPNEFCASQKTGGASRLGMSNSVRDVREVPVISREVPVLSVLPQTVTHPAWANKDTTFEEITRNNPGPVRGREDSIFSTLDPAGHAPPETNPSSVPIFYKLHGMNDYESRPLPFGGPFWPGVVEAQPEDLAPRTPRPRKGAGPVPIGGPFWPGVERPRSAPRISLRRDYPVPPLFSEMHSAVNLRKAGQKENVLKPWIDRMSDGAATTSFVGEGNYVLARPGMQGYSFDRPTSAILPHNYDHPSVKNQSGSKPQMATTLAHAPHDPWAPEALPIDRGRPQTVNSIARGSPAENLFNTNRERKLVSAMKRPATAQSQISSVRSGVTFSPFPSRPCTPCRPATAETRTSRVENAYGMTMRSRPHHLQNRLHAHNIDSRNRDIGSGSRSVSVRRQRLQSQLWEEMESVRLLS